MEDMLVNIEVFADIAIDVKIDCLDHTVTIDSEDVNFPPVLWIGGCCFDPLSSSIFQHVCLILKCVSANPSNMKPMGLAATTPATTVESVRVAWSPIVDKKNTAEAHRCCSCEQ